MEFLGLSSKAIHSSFFSRSTIKLSPTEIQRAFVCGYMQYQNVLAVDILRNVFFHILVVAGWVPSLGHKVLKGQASFLSKSPVSGI